MPTTLKPRHVYLASSGDLRLSANQKCWPEQAKMEAALAKALKAAGWTPVRAHPYDKARKHGFIDSQKMGMEVFRRLDPNAPLIVAESVWQYSHHVLSGLMTHRGPILTLANWSGTWPGLVGMLNLNGSLTKAGVKYSTLWSGNFSDNLFKDSLRRWLTQGALTHDQSHVKDLSLSNLPEADRRPSSVFSTKAAWGCIMPSSRMNCSIAPASSRNVSASLPFTPPCSQFRMPKPGRFLPGSSARGSGSTLAGTRKLN
jgi:hypothetical protein